MAQCIVRDWQGKEAGKASLDLKTAREETAGGRLRELGITVGDRIPLDTEALVRQAR